MPTDPKVIKKIFLFGEINEGLTKEVITDLVKTDFEETPITHLEVYICSEGGYLHECFAMIDYIDEIKEKYHLMIETFGMGEVASAGFFLFLMGDKRHLTKSCRVYVHEHITQDPAEKTYGERIKADKTEEKEVYEIYCAYTSRQLKCNIKKAKKLLSLNKWLSHKEIEHYDLLGLNNGVHEPKE